jgi:O-antigen ligase
MSKKINDYLAIIIPILWMLRISSRGFMYWLNPDVGIHQEIDYIKGSPIDRAFFLILEVAGLIVLLKRDIDWKLFFKKNFILILLYSYMGLSILWSDFTDVSFKRWIRTIGDLIMVTIILTDHNYVNASVKMFRIGAYILLPMSIILVKYFRNFGVSYDYTGKVEMWIGVTTHKNSLGQLVCIFCLFFLWNYLSKSVKSRIYDIPIFLIGLWLLNGSVSSTSRTSLTVFIIGSFFLIITKLMKEKTLILNFMTYSFFAIMIIGTTLSQHLFAYNFIPLVIAKTGGDPTLTGRTFLWDALIELGKNHWIFGSGFGGFWIGEYANNLWKIFTWNPGQAHNGYIDVYIDVGIIGICLLVIMIFVTYRSIIRSISAGSEFAKLRFAIFITVLIYNFTESSFLKPTSFLWFTFLLIAVQTAEIIPEKVKEKTI